MEKLVMLLDIYEEEVVGVHSVGEHITEKDEAWIISKKFGFIKWLVENDKIDKDKFICSYEHYISKLDDAIIARLAIQDEPISFLCEILKYE